MKRRRKVFILGAGLCQVPLVQKCHSMDLEVLVASIPGPYPAFKLADRAYYVDVRNYAAILKIAQDEKVDAVFTDQTDIPVATAARVTETLGLPGIGTQCGLRFTNKKVMRQECVRLGIPVPRGLACGSIEQLTAWAENAGCPVVVKPVDNQGSRGVRLVNSIVEIGDALREAFRYSAAGEVLVEEYRSGREVVIEGLALDGSFINLVVGDRYDFKIPGRFIPQATLFPTNFPKKAVDRLRELNRRLITGFGLPFGITHSEFLMDIAKNEVTLVEVAARGGGVFISSDLIPLASGVDVNELLIRRCLGERVTFDTAMLTTAASGYVCFSLPEGVISQQPNTADVESIKGVHCAHLRDLIVGKEIHCMKDKTMRLGPILLRAKDRATLDQVRQQVRETLTIKVSTTEGIRGPIWE